MSKKEISKEKLIEKLPLNAQKLFLDNDRLQSIKQHDYIWRDYFNKCNPTYEEIMKCFKVMKPSDPTDYFDYPFDIKGYTILPGIDAGIYNPFMSALVLHADHEVFWNKCSSDLIRKYKKIILEYFGYGCDLSKNSVRLINYLKADYNWMQALSRFHKGVTKKKFEIVKPIIEKNLKYVFAQSNADKYPIFDTHYNVLDYSSMELFDLVKAGIKIPSSFLNDIMELKTFLLQSKSFKRLVRNAVIEDENDAILFKGCKNEKEKDNIRKFINRIQKHSLYIIIRT